MPSAARLLVLSASLALGTTSIARADNADQAPPSSAPVNAPQNPTDARIEVARALAESAKGKVTELSTRLQADRQEATQIRERMLSGESALRQMQAKAENASARLAARRQELAAEGARYAEFRDAFEQARLDAVRDFNASPQYRSAVEAVNAAAANLRSTSDEPARARLSAAKAALDDFRRRFMDEQLPQIPRVASAEQPLKIEQARCDELTVAITAAEQQVGETQADLKQQNDGLARDRAALGELTADISRCEAELPGAQADADKADRDLNRAVASADTTRQAPIITYPAAPSASPPTVVYRYASPYGSSYGSYAPAVVYGQPGTVYLQPGTVYARTPYYGSYIVPSRGYVYGSSGIRYYGRVYVGHDYHRVGHR